MARIVIKEAQASHKLQVVDEEGNIRLRGICMCGLSSNLPFCNGSHRKAEDEEEGVLYTYKENGTREECSIQMGL
ncbi:MAG TPA: CDGSH iron-sulfur domain-containing protein [Halobacteriales archaeon]|uniref:CDGSH iron-sulfur domain-containing protein n=1 Tax=Candidatus Hikarchaeum yamanae TaxID=2675326 RepID=UPI001807361E|nr:CDGSH iron-sulfur domain-containing protein [Halobacteriales archaeon]|tara:strand:+ start:18727 stop:18951 length:225 start_codon:yes stop_codon:yes gene_type:complete